MVRNHVFAVPTTFHRPSLRSRLRGNFSCRSRLTAAQRHFLLFAAAIMMHLKLYQLRLRTLFVILTAVSVPLGCFAYVRQKAREKSTAIDTIMNLGAAVSFKPPGSYRESIYLLLAGDPGTLEFVDFSHGEARFPESELMNLSQFTEIKELNLGGNRQIGDRGMLCISGLTKLESLDLSGTSVTDNSVVRLGQLANLRNLTLKDTKITFAGLEKLHRGMPNCVIWEWSESHQ